MLDVVSTSEDEARAVSTSMRDTLVSRGFTMMAPPAQAVAPFELLRADGRCNASVFVYRGRTPAPRL
jgi:hypothetical protein